MCDSDELKIGEVKEIRALNRVFVLWRRSDGKPICQDAFCLHLGANLASNGKIVDDCIQCCFHKWKYSSDGTINEIPYLKDSKKTCANMTKKLKTYHCVDWCGLVFIYFHADNAEPEFQMPEFVPKQLQIEGWQPHLKFNVGFLPLSPVDWVDQAGDHAHFHTLHNDLVIPWTILPLPEWVFKLIPVGICHDLATYRGDDAEWEQVQKEVDYGCVDKHLIFFTDKAGLTWRNEPLPTTLSQTIEMYVGPAMMVFHIPFSIGTFKVFVSTLPVEGGSIMRVRTWIDKRTSDSYVLRWVAWLLQGLSASQLYSDFVIMSEKIRLKKPLIVHSDGPYNRTNAWLQQFYSASSEKESYAYKNDW